MLNISSTLGNFFSALSSISITLSATLNPSSTILSIGSFIFESKLFNRDDVIVFISLATFNKLFKLVKGGFSPLATWFLIACRVDTELLNLLLILLSEFIELFNSLLGTSLFKFSNKLLKVPVVADKSDSLVDKLSISWGADSEPLFIASIKFETEFLVFKDIWDINSKSFL